MLTATIALGESLSGAVDLTSLRLQGVAMPAAWTAAVLTFQGSADGTTYQDVYDDAGNEVIVQAAAGREIGFQNDVRRRLAPWRWLQVRSGTAAVPVAQAAARTLTLVGGRDK